MSSKWWFVFAASAVLALGIAACGDQGGDGGGGLSGAIRVDGSSTVGLLTEAVAEKFNEDNPDVDVTVGISGTGGGFEKLCAGETDISDASREIEPDEQKACADGGVDYENLQVANDALTVVVNPTNPVTCMTTDQLNQVWGPDSELKSWSQIDGLKPRFDAELALYTPGSDSGTFDFFTDKINGEQGAQRPDANDVDEDDDATVTGVEGAEGGTGYLGFSLFEQNKGDLKALEIDDGKGCVAPSAETAQDASYFLSRPLFVYPSSQALQRPEVDAFLQFYLDNVNDVAEEGGFITLTPEQLEKSQSDLARFTGGGGGAATTGGTSRGGGGGGTTTGGSEATTGGAKTTGGGGVAGY